MSEKKPKGAVIREPMSHANIKICKKLKFFWERGKRYVNIGELLS